MLMLRITAPRIVMSRVPVRARSRMASESSELLTALERPVVTCMRNLDRVWACRDGPTASSILPCPAAIVQRPQGLNPPARARERQLTNSSNTGWSGTLTRSVRVARYVAVAAVPMSG